MTGINISKLNNSTVSFIGISKNAGKTTAFNAMLKECCKAGMTPGITSIGRDGERTDVVTKTEKPEIFIPAGVVFATASKLLSKSDVTKCILSSSGFNTPLGEVYIARAQTPGFVELGGPSIVSQLRSVKEQMFAFGADVALIDGAADRRSLGISSVADKVVLCAGAAYSKSMEETVEYTAFIAELFGYPEAGEDFLNMPVNCGAVKAPGSGIPDSDVAAKATAGGLCGGGRATPLGFKVSSVDTALETRGGGIMKSGEYIIKHGAVTDSSVEEIIRAVNETRAGKIVFDDPSKMLMAPESFNRLKRAGCGIFFMQKPKLLFVAVNPTSPYGYSYNAERFRAAVEENVKVPVVDVRC